VNSPRVLDVLPQLSGRARSALRTGGIETVADLAYWNEGSLRCLKNVGPVTALEIVTAARSAGLALAPEDAPRPWRLDPERWG
jgi:DNA-directed RNA polymerase alpha subunit